METHDLQEVGQGDVLMVEQLTFAVAYARVSTDDKGQNPESQLVAIRKFAKDRGIEILREFRDEKTGTNDDREGLDAMYGYCARTPKVTKMIVLDADRLSRNMDDAPALIKRFNEIGVQIVYVADENLDLTTKEGKLLNAMKSYGAQTYTDDHKIKIKAGMARAKNEGKTIGRPLKRADDIKGHIVLGFIKQGYSLRDLEQIYGCSRMTLIRRMEKSGDIEEYKKIVEPRKKSGIKPKVDY